MNNLDLQNQLLDLIPKGYSVVTETERFAHQLHWRYRRRRAAEVESAWDSPRILTLNRWMERCWEDSWPGCWPASDFTRWKILGQAIDHTPPPEPLNCDIPLILAVDECFGHCLRYGIDPGHGEPSNRLVEWRRDLWPHFKRELENAGYFHPASLPEMICTRLLPSSGFWPGKTLFFGFEFPGHWETVLIHGLLGREMNLSFNLPRCEARSPGLAFTDPEQEIYWILEDLTSAAEVFPLHELAVAVLDPDTYSPLIARGLESLFGRPLLGEQAAYNLFPDDSLSNAPLFRAAFLPVDFSLDDQPRALLLALLRSPYYGYFARRSRALAQWDRTWRRQAAERGVKALLSILSEAEKEALPLKGNELLEGLAIFLERRSRPCSAWVKALQNFWDRMQFPILADEADQIAWRQLTELLQKLATGFSSHAVTLSEFYGWLKAAADKAPIQKTGLEDAGIQVVGALDARGLSFKRLYIPGLISGALPRPVRPLPLLDSSERKRVQGGSAESQFEFGRLLFLNLQAAADQVTVTRPMMSAKGDMLLPSPFQPEGEEIKYSPVIPWRQFLPALQRARWLVDGIAGISEAAGEIDTAGEGLTPDDAASDAYSVDCFAAPNEISVSSLEALIECHSRFFFETILRLEPLPEPQRGLDPRSRGEMTHKILADFGRKIPGAEESPASWEDLLCSLKEVVDKAFEPCNDSALWKVEKKRLLGMGGNSPGLLVEWLRKELERLQNGWRWLALESSFSGLRLGERLVAIKGRLDRVDCHPEEGVICWDYKTGRIPGPKEIWEELTSPQLPVYLIAIDRGLIKEISKGFGAHSAGYIDLRSIRHLKHQCAMKGTEETLALLESCEERISAVLSSLEHGDFPPRWMNQSCDFSCPYICICGKPSSG